MPPRTTAPPPLSTAAPQPDKESEAVRAFCSLYAREFGVELEARYARELLRLGVPVVKARQVIHAFTAIAEHVIGRQRRGQTPSTKPGEP